MTALKRHIFGYTGLAICIALPNKQRNGDFWTFSLTACVRVNETVVVPDFVAVADSKRG